MLTLSQFSPYPLVTTKNNKKNIQTRKHIWSMKIWWTYHSSSSPLCLTPALFSRLFYFCICLYIFRVCIKYVVYKTHNHDFPDADFCMWICCVCMDMCTFCFVDEKWLWTYSSLLFSSPTSTIYVYLEIPHIFIIWAMQTHFIYTYFDV